MENQNPTQNTAPQSGSPVSPVGQPSPAPESKSVGALIGSIIIVIILIIGGLYLWSTKVAPVTEPPMMNNGMPVMGGTAQETTAQEQALNQPDPVLSQMAAVATSDEVASIDADLKTTNLNGLGSELQAQ